MKIINVSLVLMSFPTSHYISGWRLVNRTYHLLAFIILDEGVIGIGEGTPYWSHILDDYKLTMKLAEEILGLELYDALEYLRTAEMEMLDKRRIVNYGTFLALESALLDTFAKRRKIPLSALLGEIYRKDIPVCGTVFLNHPRKMAENARRWLSKGVSHLKVKIPLNLEDLERVLISIKEAVNENGFSDITIRVDANEGFRTFDRAVEALKLMERYGVAIVEQPLPRDRLSEMRKLRALFTPSVKIMIDESLRDPSDILVFAQEEVCDIVNFHPPKLGCLTVTRDTILKAQKLGLKVQLGSALMTDVGLAQYLHLAASLPTLDYPLEEVGLYELYGYSLVPEPLVIEKGKISLPKHIGLGINLDMSLMKVFSLRINDFLFLNLHNILSKGAVFILRRSDNTVRKREKGRC